MFNKVKTWTSGPWPFTDANLYIRDNFNSVRNYQTGTQMFGDTGTAGTSTTTIGTHLNLLAATPDESFEMQVFAMFIARNVVTASGCTIDILDHNSVSITLNGSQNMAVGSFTTASGGGISIAGKATFSAGVNPGFIVTGRAGAGTVPLTVHSQVICRPLV